MATMNSAEKCEEVLANFDQIAPSLINPEDPQTERDLLLFRKLFCQFLSEPYKVDWSHIRPMAPEQQFPYETLPQIEDGHGEREALLKRLVVVKLNGGLGTTMGCQGPKSLVELRDGLSFLDFSLRQHEILNQKYASDVPLLLMNSFNTDQETREYLAAAATKYQSAAAVECFCQSRCPRIFADSMLPVPSCWTDCPKEGWYPPGHGNVFWAMSQSGLLDRLLANGRNLAFFANIDNTGAIFDESIAKVLSDGRADYVMEMTPRTMADVKGGTLVEIVDEQRIMHLECPQVPADRVDEFCSLETFKMFNTNNIWVNLEVVRDRLDQMKMEILANEKRLPSGQSVLQLEQSIGGAIRNFPGRALAVCVPRTRFLPVKSTRDLFRMRSRCLFEFDPAQCLLRQKAPSLPEVHLSSEFASLADFERRIPEIPLLHSSVQRISLQGDVWLAKGIQMHGIVEVHAGKGQCVRVPENSIIGQEEGAKEKKGGAGEGE